MRKYFVSGSVTDSLNDSEYYYLGRKILVQQNFTKKEDRPFDAYYQSLTFLNDRGYDYGSLAVTSSPNIAVKKGIYDLPEKWHNLDKEDIASIDGVIRSLDYREGSVTVMLFNVMQLYAVACRLCAVWKLRIGAVMP